VSIITPSIFAGAGIVRCGMSTRGGGVSLPPLGMNLSFQVGDERANVIRNRELFLGTWGIHPDQLAIPGQIHSARVRYASVPGEYPDCDALVTEVAGVYLSVTVADCVPILLVDPAQHVAAAIHAGWRGTAARILERSLSVLLEQYGSSPRDILAYIGPCASSCCYAVGQEVATQFEDRFISRVDGKWMLDLKESNHTQLLDAGLPPSNIEVSPFCTIADARLFHSFRREGARSGRMMAVIGFSA
jgi:polyphenol oxidase